MSKLSRTLVSATVGAFALSVLAPTLIGSSTPAAAAEFGLRINEVESSGGTPGDWIEFLNVSDAAVELSEYIVQDNSTKNPYTIPPGTVVEPGDFYVIDELDGGVGNFDFGLGGGDSVRLFAPGADSQADEPVLTETWPEHAATTYGVDTDGVWRVTSESTKGAVNLFDAAPLTDPVRLNEIDSQPADWVELFNTSEGLVDISGYELRDNSDDHRWEFPAESTIAAGGFLVIDENSMGLVDGVLTRFGDPIGIGSADKARLYDASGALIDDSGTWNGHAILDGDAALATLARCPDGQGDFVLAHPTPGSSNTCVDPSEIGDGEEETPLKTDPWPGQADTRVVGLNFLEDSSGLDTQTTDEGVALWAVDNGEGRFWKMNVEADGSTAFAPGWQSGKRVRFQKDARNAAAAGPDTEGVTAAGDGFLYFASERDNSAKGVNWNVVLKADPDASGPDVVATQEWDLTSQLPAVSANLGIEAVEWVADADLTGLVDENTGKSYNPADYSLHGDGLFFVAVEDGGQVFAFALNSDETAEKIATIKPGLAGVMALDYDEVLGGLWTVCDDGCDGAMAFLTFNGTADPEIKRFARPAGLPNTNNEGFATGPQSLIGSGFPAMNPAAGGSGSVPLVATPLASILAAGPTASMRPAWWFTDGLSSGSMRVGMLSAVPVGGGSGGLDGPGGSVDRAGGVLANTGGQGQQFMFAAAALLFVLGSLAILLSRRKGFRRGQATLEEE